MRPLTFLFLLLTLSTIGYGLTTLTVDETETVRVTLDILDPDNDSLTIKYSYPLDDTGVFETDYGDAGRYSSEVVVSDGEDEVIEELLIVVNKKEEVPSINSVSPSERGITIAEGERLPFVVDASDIDRDELTYRWLLDNEEVSTSTSFTFETDFESEGEYTVTLEVSDGTHTLEDSWDVNVANVDREAQFLPIQSVDVLEGQKVIIELDAQDPDGERVEFSADSLPRGATLEGNTFTWIIDYDTVRKEGTVDSILDKFHLLSESFQITFNAESGETSVSRSVIIRVLDQNRRPIFVDMPVRTFAEGDEVVINPEVEDLDGDVITASFDGWMRTNSKKTNYNDAGTHYVSVTISDGFSENTQVYEIRILDTNRIPNAKIQTDRSYREGDHIQIRLTGSDLDNDAVSFRLVSGPLGALIRDGHFEWTPGYDISSGDSVDIPIVLSAQDKGSSIEIPFTLTIHNSNQAPVITQKEPQKVFSAYVGEPVQFVAIAEDSDGDSLEYKWDFGFFETFEASAIHERTFTEEGVKEVSVTVSDGEDETKHTWMVNVIEKVEPVYRQPVTFKKYIITE